jgi:predicted mannosyl-3-phosphoglycerate phosphatase (HAD superfamily)
MDEKVGQMAFSNQNLNTESLDDLLKLTITSAKFEYTFSTPGEEDLKKFWEQHGSHYDMISKQKMRRLKKKSRDEKKTAGGDSSNKRQKVEEDDRAFTIAGVTYANINKVKSKAKAIMNVKEDGQKLEGYEEEFMKEIIKNHPTTESKMKDFANFVVDEHPDYSNTR